MSLFKKLFGASESSDDDKDGNLSPFNPETVIPADELFTLNFKKNGGK
ncbi:MAG: lactate utilization protein B/C, partial [Flavobacteriaceae bacterium]